MPAGPYVRLQHINTQVYESVPVQLGAYANSHAPATVVPRRINLATDDDMTTLMYPRLEYSKQATDLREEADKNLRQGQKQSKKDYD